HQLERITLSLSTFLRSCCSMGLQPQNAANSRMDICPLPPKQSALLINVMGALLLLFLKLQEDDELSSSDPCRIFTLFVDLHTGANGHTGQLRTRDALSDVVGCILSSPTGPILCGKPILRSTVPSYCSLHFQKAEKHVTRALKKAGLNVSNTSKLAPKFHVIVAEYVSQIQNKRRAAQKATLEIAEVKEENSS
ncbi:hypothetical protein HAX54_042653, partial [Datura stramonium]|nr:hypothetical protein [Datura stramonium]